ncbi:MAG: transglutaminase family protein [Terracidiphilus sp.]
MLIRLAYDIRFDVPAQVAMVALLNIHPSRVHDLIEPDELRIEPCVPVTSYIDSFGNRCARFVAPPGSLRLSNTTLIRDSGFPDTLNLSAREASVGDLPHEILSYLLNSRYCEVDRFNNIAFELFGSVTPGWNRVQYICNWVHNNVAFNYQQARPTKTALDVFTERVGVCRDFQHLAITFCRALNIPALCDGLSGRHRSSRAPAHGLQRLVRGMARRPLVDIRRPQQPAAHRPHPDGYGPGRIRCRHDHRIRPSGPDAFFGGYRRRE